MTGAIELALLSRRQTEYALRTIRCVTFVLISSGCAATIPADFVPDPKLVSRIAEIRMNVSTERVCPGEYIAASYQAVLRDGSVMPFATRYDDENPPALHVSFLERTSEEAEANSNGGWDTLADPLESIVRGFRLGASLEADPSLVASTVVEPSYDCQRHVYDFVGAPGNRRGRGGRPGPDIVVRADILSSPFYEQLFVASLEVGEAPPIHVVADFETIPPSDWLVIASRGGQGGPGVDGTVGETGAKGNEGCPAGNGGAGGAGGSGGPGGAGGVGGRVTIFVPEDQPLLAGLIEARVEGGPGGRGGKPGKGGAGGAGGEGITQNRRVTCEDGAPGPDGPDGPEGPRGPGGRPGPRPQIITVPVDQVFGDRAHAIVIELIDYNTNRRRGKAPGNGSHQ